MNNLAELYAHRRRYELAEPLLSRTLIIKKRVLGMDHPGVAMAMTNYAYLLRKLKFKAEAAALEKETKQILAKCSPHCITPQVVNARSLTHAGRR